MTPAKIGETCWASVACIQLAPPTGITRTRKAGARMLKVAPVDVVEATAKTPGTTAGLDDVGAEGLGEWVWVMPSELSHFGSTWWITRPATPTSTARATRPTSRRSHSGAPGLRGRGAGRPGTAGVTPVSTTARGTWSVLEWTPSVVAPVPEPERATGAPTELAGGLPAAERETAMTGMAPVSRRRATPTPAAAELVAGACTTTTGPEPAGVAGQWSISDRAYRSPGSPR